MIVIFGVFSGGELSVATGLVLALITLAFKLVKRPIGILVFLTVLLGLAVFLGLRFENELFAAYLYTLEGLFFCFPVALVLGLIAVGFKWAKRPIGTILSYSLLVSSSCVVALVAFDATGNAINRWKVDAVEAYVARAVPVLDQIKQKDGTYPSKLPTDVLGEPPELLRLYGDYKATGPTFRFEYEDEPAGWAGGEGDLIFNSSSRKWRDWRNGDD